jgi:hypothetical protein
MVLWTEAHLENWNDGMADFANVAFPALAVPQLRDGVGWLRRLKWKNGCLKGYHHSSIPIFHYSSILTAKCAF